MSLPVQWRPIPGYPDYLVSDRGQVVSLKRGRRRLLRDQDASGGHRRIQIGGASHKTFLVHQLVMLGFVGPYPDGMEVRHLNGDPTDNRLSNLRYGTRAENIQDQKDHGVHYFATRTHCPKGHEYDEVNTYRDYRGWRQCRQCKREKWEAWRAVTPYAPRIPPTCCPQGHLYDETNAMHDATSGARRCRTCRRQQARLAQQRRKARLRAVTEQAV